MGWHQASSWRLAASVEQLAKEAYEDLLGYEGEGGHKPPRDDIAKFKQLHDLQENARGGVNWVQNGPDNWTPHDRPPDEEAKALWQQMTQLTTDEREILDSYARSDVADGFDETVAWYEKHHPPQFKDDQPWEDILRSALRKHKNQRGAETYGQIHTALSILLEDHPASYKLWPWLVRQIKDSLGSYSSYTHMAEVVGAAGDQIHELRQNHRLPSNLDVNRMDFSQFEDWWMDWKRENRTSEENGEVVYTYDDGWTIQRLTTPEQLQAEGDTMGHCVGDYAHPVLEGDSIIYSLRDRKDKPHVTIEMEGPELRTKTSDQPFDQREEPLPGHTVQPVFKNGEEHQTYHNPTAEDVRENIWPSFMLKRERVTPHAVDGEQEYYNDIGVPWDKSFYVVQVMGGKKEDPHNRGYTVSNTTPAPELQHKIKEFLDYLKSQGVKFIRSDDYAHPHDAEDEELDNDINDTSDLDSMYHSFRNHPEKWVGSHEDVYGIEVPRQYANGGGVQEWIEQIIKKYTTPDMREKYSWGELGDPEEMAEQIYYYASLGNFTTEATRAALYAGWEFLQNRENDALDNVHWDEHAPPYDVDDPDFDEDEYYRQLDEAQRDYLGDGFSQAQEFLGYLDALVSKHGVPEPKDMPHNGGGPQGRIPAFREIKDEWSAGQQPNAPAPEVQPFPGAFQ